MASFIDRVLTFSDWDTDGGQIYASVFHEQVKLYAAGLRTAADIKAMWSCTTEQAAELDEILATQPSTGLLATLVNAKAVAQWPVKVSAIFKLASDGWEFPTKAAVRTALGI